ncbi:acyl-CoA dehydrogenase family protein [Wohlfahrtiimonas chitiniclastica]|uniref:acyl-CoA dehydrogenase family protein n=1 Tax=Wohlfahrtiimonas chitiniclastica TaxID=400946 RepID=UPI001BCEFE4A|nr:acyl-CoA dehydrogenase family protein [Wohlfahrtiimonas chitiniclastica]MBS7814735.1 acyl-CoA dehydrogenase family protein [Wohlfahrtiimonas chitiniclastica]MBS7817112.1 acyl-CoA dehydrogenase family protein [Wohlfahrtiimonas chitiniclastica]MBS7823033.1 acyl-CoA dehydrogenase family protein [Wohlfahrtiimonas chitiniclastica]MBS7830847.1 acyl-CoA dehydrogenase family protein [Wohlfahrtiimonas chitiniclastica]MBS7832815.1 acyl-CoA dehydrogenase family protein [Wohlfahrtiimonas chitiniclastic
MTLFTHDTMGERLALTQKTAQAFKARAHHHDQNNTFPFENIEDLKRIAYPALTLSTEYGGIGVTLEEMLRHQVIIAENDAATALAIGWHIGMSKQLSDDRPWAEMTFREFAKDVVAKGALINSAATEAATGSPTRGGLPETTARTTEFGWVITGHKTFTTLSPVLDYFVVSARINDTDEVGQFLVKRTYGGLRIEETWNMLGMRATGSHDLILDQVSLPKDALLMTKMVNRAPQGWLLHIPAVYYGIAKAALNEALEFAAHYAPNSLATGTIGDLPLVQQKLGQMCAKLIESEYLLFGVARDWDAADAKTRSTLGDALAVTKTSVVNHAIEVVDLAMRLVGARSLSMDNPLQRLYRDVRAGLHNPPMEDMVYINLAQSALRTLRENHHASVI